jgi:hypothetical protein
MHCSGLPMPGFETPLSLKVFIKDQMDWRPGCSCSLDAKLPGNSEEQLSEVSDYLLLRLLHEFFFSSSNHFAFKEIFPKISTTKFIDIIHETQK